MFTRKIRTFLSILITVMLAAVMSFSTINVAAEAPGSGASPNLLVNPGFESGNDGWDDWGNSGFVASDANSGTNSMKVGTAAGGRAQTLTSDVKGGEGYTFKCYGKSDGNTASAMVQCFDSNWAKLSENWLSGNFTSTYSEKSLEFTTPKGTAIIVVALYKGDDAKYAYYDDVSLVKNVSVKPTPTPTPKPKTSGGKIILTPPAQAAAVGYNRLSFNDDFNSLKTIDVNGTGKPGYNWYTDLPFGWGKTAKSSYSVSDSVLKLASGEKSANWALGTYSAKGDTGASFKYGYFECRMHFDPKVVPANKGFPAWWSFSVSHTKGTNNERFPEIDFFEAWHPEGKAYDQVFYGTFHESTSTDEHYANNKNKTFLPDGTDLDQWHTYGCLWTPGSVTWYFDDEPLYSQHYSPGKVPSPQTDPAAPAGTFSCIDKDTMLLILGTAEDWPIYVDWVRVWQRSGISGYDSEMSRK